MLWFHCITIQHSENNQHASQSEKTIILNINFQEVHYYALSGVPLKAQPKHAHPFLRTWSLPVVQNPQQCHILSTRWFSMLRLWSCNCFTGIIYIPLPKVSWGSCHISLHLLESHNWMWTEVSLSICNSA